MDDVLDAPTDFILSTKVIFFLNCSNSKLCAITRFLFHPRTSYLVLRYNSIRRILNQGGNDLNLRLPFVLFICRSSFNRNHFHQNEYHISDVISTTDFILGTKVQPDKANSMNQVAMICDPTTYQMVIGV